MKIGEKISKAIRPDAQGFDEVRIITVPRYKTSGLSGDEWRISGHITLLRKGRIIHEETYRDIETAAKFLPFVIAQAQDAGKGYYGGEGEFCDQEGCLSHASRYFKLKRFMCAGPGCCGQEKKKFTEMYRKFCEQHKRRGDCGLDDSDDNYEEISNPEENEPK